MKQTENVSGSKGKYSGRMQPQGLGNNEPAIKPGRNQPSYFQKWVFNIVFSLCIYSFLPSFIHFSAVLGNPGGKYSTNVALSAYLALFYYSCGSKPKKLCD